MGSTSRKSNKALRNGAAQSSQICKKKNTPYRHSEQQTPSLESQNIQAGHYLLRDDVTQDSTCFTKLSTTLQKSPWSITQHRTAHSQVEEIKESSYAPSLKLMPSSIRSFLAPSLTGTTWTKTQLSKPLLNNSRSSSCTNLCSQKC